MFVKLKAVGQGNNPKDVWVNPFYVTALEQGQKILDREVTMICVHPSQAPLLLFGNAEKIAKQLERVI